MEKVVIVLSMVLALCMSCKQNKNGSYAYIDALDVIHAKQGCTAVAKIRNAQAVTPIPLTDIKAEMLNRICSQCVDETTLSVWQKIAKANSDSLVPDTIGY